MYATTREFLERFGLNDLSDLPKVEEMSDALGFELPNALLEPTVDDDRRCRSSGSPEEAIHTRRCPQTSRLWSAPATTRCH